jgi:poly-gamma-glutamate synthesis protein (capsule biosynthesis protein)
VGYILYPQALGRVDNTKNSSGLVEQKEKAPPQPIPEDKPLSILFGGDIFLDRSIRLAIQSKGVDYLWQDIAPFLSQYKYKVANLEGPVVSRAQPAPAGSFSFAFQPEYVDKLKDLGFTHLSLANNHTLNQGSKGLTSSRAYLNKIGINYFGDPSNIAAESVWKGEIEGRKIAFVGEHDLIAEGQQDILNTIRILEKENYFIIAMPHWGPEYNLGIPTIEKVRAHALIDAGADVIIGAHPHVVQPIEVYKNKAIFYSLGNFLFDQHFSYDTLHGLLVDMSFQEQGVYFKLYPTEQDKTFQIHMAQGGVRQKMLDRISTTSIVSADIASDIAKGEFHLSR